MDPLLAPIVRGLGCPPAAPNDHWCGVYASRWAIPRLGNNKKVGGCGWTGCPRNLVLSHVAQDTARSWFRACLTQTTHIHAVFGPFLGHIMQLEGRKGLLVTGQSRRTWTIAAICLRLAVLTGFWGRFGPKRLFWGTNCTVLGGHLPSWRPRPGAPPVSFWLKTWIWQGHHLGNDLARVE